MELDTAIKSRRSVREFTDEKPDWKDVIEAIDSARHAPAAGGDFAMKFILVDEKDKIKKIAAACQQDFIAKAHYLVAALSDPARLVNVFGDKGETYAKQQAGASIQNFLLKLEEKNLSTCWTGHFVEEQVKETLGIKDGINVEGIFPVGISFRTKKRDKKTEIDRFLYFNSYGNRQMKKKRIVEG